VIGRFLSVDFYPQNCRQNFKTSAARHSLREYNYRPLATILPNGRDAALENLSMPTSPIPRATHGRYPNGHLTLLYTVPALGE
jgi:hypothetical protein